MAFVNFPEASAPEPKTCPHAPPASCIWGDHCRCKSVSGEVLKLFTRQPAEDDAPPD